MNKKSINKILADNLKNLLESVQWLQRSYNLCEKIGLKKQYSAEEFDAFENLTSRFARTCDFIINKIFRSIDKVELEPSGTTIDVINRAHKRGLIESAEKMREIKTLRNEIAHEYASRELQDIFKEILKYTPILITTADKINTYCAQLKT